VVHFNVGSNSFIWVHENGEVEGLTPIFDREANLKWISLSNFRRPESQSWKSYELGNQFLMGTQLPGLQSPFLRVSIILE